MKTKNRNGGRRRDNHPILHLNDQGAWRQGIELENFEFVKTRVYNWVKQAFSYADSDKCLICGKDGELLVCIESGCSIVVHKNCFGFMPHFDDTGYFICPICHYDIAAAEVQETGKMVRVVRAALTDFLREEYAGTSKEEHPPPSPNPGKYDKNSPESHGLQNQCVELEEDHHGVAVVPSSNANDLPCKGGEENQKNDVLQK